MSCLICDDHHLAQAVLLILQIQIDFQTAFAQPSLGRGLMAGTATNVEQIASTENCTVRQINMTISLAFLAPNLVQGAIDGRLPRGVGIANLRDAPADWSLQYARLGLAS